MAEVADDKAEVMSASLEGIEEPAMNEEPSDHKEWEAADALRAEASGEAGEEDRADAKRRSTKAARAAARMNKPYDREEAREKRNARRRRVKEFAYDKTPDKFKNASSFQVRLRTGAVYVTLSILFIMMSRWTTLLLVCATAGVCAGEFYYMLRSDAKLPNESIGIVAAILYPIGAFFLGLNGLVYVTILLIIALTVWYVFWLPARISDVGISLFGSVYVGMQLSALILIREAMPVPWGGVFLLILFVSIWANDAFAYMFGSKFGKHKLAPRVSPKKSWEGFFAGLMGSTLLWCLTLLVPGMDITVYQALLFGLLCGIAGVIGDLCESRIKRGTGFKDSGTIMPGHGGLFDRCDSLITTAVVAALLLFGSGCLTLAL